MWNKKKEPVVIETVIPDCLDNNLAWFKSWVEEEDRKERETDYKANRYLWMVAEFLEEVHEAYQIACNEEIQDQMQNDWPKKPILCAREK